MNRKRNLGATGRFPYGKLNEDDEGELRIAVGGDRDTETVIIDFGTPTTWIGMRPEDAEAFARSILEKARQVRR